MLETQVLQHFADKQWAVLDSLLSFKESQDLLDGLLLRKEQMRPARIGSLEQKSIQSNIRSDFILWVEHEADPLFSTWNHRIQQLTKSLKEEFFLPLKSSEFHFAHYPKGSFYSRHIDQPQSSHNRLISVVHYLNPDWNDNWGGQIVLYTKEGPIKIQPKSPRTLIFQSQKVEHEVLPTEKDRFSLTGWLL